MTKTNNTLSSPFTRCELMLGEKNFCAIGNLRIAIFGLGGVGGWCAESLARTGVKNLLLVDSDEVAQTNINRQIMATSKTIGQKKVDVLAMRLKEINPEISVETRDEIYNAESAASFHLETFDYVIDAIDSLTEKACLIRHALSLPNVTLFSSMGAALKSDVCQIRTSSFRKVEGDGLARALRHKFRATGNMPERNFQCVWSPEHRENLGTQPEIEASDSWGARKARINGTVAHTTAVFGFALAGLVINDVVARMNDFSD